MAPRTSFPASQRRDQILDAARDLFATKGYQATTIEDLMAACGIAKGTLYYHFKGKEEVLLALVVRTVAEMTTRASAVAAGDGSALDRLLAAIVAARAQEHELVIAEEMNASGKAEFHLLGVVELTRRLGPVLAGIIVDGVASGEFDTPDPLTAAEMVLVSASVLLDGGIFTGEEDQLPRRTVGVMAGIGRVLGCDDEAVAVAMERLA